MSQQDNYLFKVIGSVVMSYGMEKPDPETLVIARKIIDLVEKATEARIIKLLEGCMKTEQWHIDAAMCCYGECKPFTRENAIALIKRKAE